MVLAGQRGLWTSPMLQVCPQPLRYAQKFLSVCCSSTIPVVLLGTSCPSPHPLRHLLRSQHPSCSSLLDHISFGLIQGHCCRCCSSHVCIQLQMSIKIPLDFYTQILKEPQHPKHLLILKKKGVFLYPSAQLSPPTGTYHGSLQNFFLP